MLPNLICIGAAKCGTTSLHRYLDLHPEVFMAEGKELNFFTGPDWNWKRGLDWYQAQFPTDARVRGETSHTYSNHPFAEGVPERIRATLGDVKLLYVVSDPVTRLVSDWVGEYANGHESMTFHELVDSPHLEQTGYVMRGRYANQLMRFQRIFEGEELKVVSRDELSARPNEVMAGVFGFLGVDPTFKSKSFDHVHNPSAPKRRDRRLAPLLRRMPGSARLESKGMATRGLSGRLLRIPFSRAVRRPVPTHAQRERLRSCFAEDAERLRELTGHEFPGWSV